LRAWFLPWYRILIEIEIVAFGGLLLAERRRVVLVLWLWIIELIEIFVHVLLDLGAKHGFILEIVKIIRILKLTLWLWN